jgi:GntR family transcriptional regulator
MEVLSVIMTIDLSSETPIYQQLRDRVVEAIANGSFSAGDPLPSTRGLAADLGVNFHTVNKAYDLLRQEGLVRITRKSGAVIARDANSGPPEPGFVAGWQERAATLLAEAVAHGVPPAELLERCRAVLDTGSSNNP